MRLKVCVFALYLASCTNANIQVSSRGKSSTSDSSPELSIESSATTSEYGVASVKVSLSKVSSKDVTFNFYTQDSTASAGTDYESANSSSIIPAGELSTYLPISIFDNLIQSGNKIFRIGIANSMNAKLSTSSLSNVTILDNEITPGLLATSVSAAANSNYTCAVTTLGGVKCWGSNGNGQLGDGTTTSRSVPTDIPSLTSGVASVSAGAGTTCALTTSGGAKCWGGNGNGQIGDGSITQRNSPADVSGLTSNVTAVVTGGGFHTCGILNTGGLKCWGWNFYGQLGDGTTTLRNTPVNVSGLSSGVASVALGNYHTCALTTGGGVKCWGWGAGGQLGDGTGTDRVAPVDVTGLTSGVSILGVGYAHTCALTTGGGVKCWGENGNGQLGDGTTTNRNAPTDVGGLTSGVVSISVGFYNSCATLSSGTVMCWGKGMNGLVGDGNKIDSSIPVVAKVISQLPAAMSVGHTHACAILSGQRLNCWGDNSSNQLANGLGTTTYKTIPTDFFKIQSTAKGIAVGAWSSCAFNDTNAGCVGGNANGQLGDGSINNKHAISQLNGASVGVTSMSAAGYHACAVVNGGAKCWGTNGSGQLGDGSTTQRISPVDVLGLTSGVKSVAVGYTHSCALLNNGSLRCWGAAGMLGDGTSTQQSTPQIIFGAGQVQAVSSYNLHTCVLKANGGVQCWGSNTNGELGDGTNSARTLATDVLGLTSGVTKIAVGYNHTCALLATGAIKCWGMNTNGQLGNAYNSNSSLPVSIASSLVFKDIYTGGMHTCALDKNGGAYCWGWNFYGQLGLGAIADKWTPEPVLGFNSGITSMGLGYQHSCALTSNGSMKCWGDYSSGQFAPTLSNLVPQPVLSN